MSELLLEMDLVEGTNSIENLLLKMDEIAEGADFIDERLCGN